MTETSFDLGNARAHYRGTVGLDALSPTSEKLPPDREDLMLSHSKTTRLRFVVTMCMLLAGGAVSMGTSCIKPATGPKAGNIEGTVDTNSAPVAGAVVTATITSSGATYTGTSAADGTYLISGIADGAGTVTVTTFPSTCAAGTASNYDLTGKGTQTFNFNLVCTP
jgi:Carboxypeptidase regulatory-like domain